MVKTFLPDDLPTMKVVDDIYSKLSENILKEIQDEQLYCKYKEDTIFLDTQQKIKMFLLSKNFYEYKFNEEGNFYQDLIFLRGNIKVDNLLSGNTDSEEIKVFLRKYPKEEYGKEYDILETGYKGKKISEIRQQENDSFPESAEYQLIKKAFDYGKIHADDRNSILNAMDVPVCPYCNMNYTMKYGKERNAADIDHFYIKSRYPQYALCLYNFVPACPVCNSKLKGKKDTTRQTHVFPHEESYGKEAEFEILNLIELSSGKSEKAELKLINHGNNPKIDNSVETFKINELYDFHSSYAKDLLDKVWIYNDSYMEEFKRFISEKSEDIKGIKDIKELIFGRDEPEEIYARKSLGKLRMDLLRQLGVYE